MQSTQERLGRALERLATGTNVLRSRANDQQRAARNGTAVAAREEAACVRLEIAVDAVWSAIHQLPGSDQLREAA